MDNISKSLLSLTNSFFICRSAAEEICLFRMVLGFRIIHGPALKSGSGWGRGEIGNAYLLRFARICLPFKLSDNITCFLTFSSVACKETRYICKACIAAGSGT